MNEEYKEVYQMYEEMLQLVKGDINSPAEEEEKKGTALASPMGNRLSRRILRKCPKFLPAPNRDN